MSARRPRIKAAAILPPKRHAREGSTSTPVTKQVKLNEKPVVVDAIVAIQTEEKVAAEKTPTLIQDKPPSANDKPADDLATNAKPTVDDERVKPSEPPPPPVQIDSNDNIFKSPPIVANHKRTESFSASDAENEKSDENSFRNLHGPLSPVKFRQRIRPTPFFGMRRNSTQGYGSDIEDEPKRQRHTSTSSNTGAPMPQRIRPPNVQRIRTESSCSNFSDNRDPNAKSTRKQIHSDNHLRSHTAKREFLRRFDNKIPDKTHMKMSDLIYYNPATNPMVAADPQPKVEAESFVAATKDEAASPPKEPKKSEETAESRMPVPQLKLGPDGEMILDEQSLVIETTAEKEARQTLASSKVIYMDEFSGNNGFYRRTKRTRDWPSEETIKFYRCLHTVGTDFSLMLTLFPNRSRRDLKLKFKKEERTNLQLINKALLYPNTFNIADLKKELDKEQEEYEAKQRELDEIRKQAASQKKKQPKSKVAHISRAARTLCNGDLVYENEIIATPAVENTANTKKNETAEKKRTKKSKEPNITKIKSRPAGTKQVTEDQQIPAEVEYNTADDDWILPDVSIAKAEPAAATISDQVQTPAKQKTEQGSNQAGKVNAIIENYTYDYYPNETVNGNDVAIYEIIEEAETTISKQERNEDGRSLLNELTVIDACDSIESVACSSSPISPEEDEEECPPAIVTDTPAKAEKIELITADNEILYMDEMIDDDFDEDERIMSVAAKDIDAEMEQFMLNDLGMILTNLINGSLVVVASEDETDPNKVINEIYVMCKETGALSKKPLDLPEDVVNCIVEELNAN